MRGDETELLVKALRLRTLLVGGQLKLVAAPRLGALDGPSKEPAPEARAAMAGLDAHAFDRGTPTALMREVRREDELEDGDGGPVFVLGDDQLVVRIAIDGDVTP